MASNWHGRNMEGFSRIAFVFEKAASDGREDARLSSQAKRCGGGKERR